MEPIIINADLELNRAARGDVYAVLYDMQTHKSISIAERLAAALGVTVAEDAAHNAGRVRVTVEFVAAPEPEPVPDAPAADDVEPMARFDTLANGRRHDAVD